MTTPDYTKGRHSLALEKAVTKARGEGLLDDIDEAMVSIARAAAFALDYSEDNAKANYAISHLLAPYREALNELRMTPKARASAAEDVFGELLEELGGPA